MRGIGPDQAFSELEALMVSKEPAALLDAIFGFIPSGVLVARAPDGKIVRVSDIMVRLLGRSRDELEGMTLSQLPEELRYRDEAGRPLAAEELPLARALRGEVVVGFEGRIPLANGELIPIAANAAPIRNWRGELIGAISSLTDLRSYKALERSLRETVAQLEEAVAQREALYRELTHRVKNHLQIMSALVAQEARNRTFEAADLAARITGQLNALAAVYKGMDRAEAGAGVEARTFIEQVCRPYASEAVRVETAVSPSDLTLTSEQAGPVGMLVNEAVCNSRKHAFPDRSGHIQVSLRRLEPGRLGLEVADDGVGWGPVDPGETHHGLDLMRLFAKQLHCELELGVHGRGGALVAAEFAEAPT